MSRKARAKPTSGGERSAPANAVGDAKGTWAERRFVWVLAGMTLLALAARVAILWEYLARNPLSGAPINDALAYWNWAERIAHGQIVQTMPFFSAPLYPYLVGVLRALGGSLVLVYVLQIIADLTTGWLLAYAARMRFNAGTGLLAAALFWLLLEPASFSLRVLTCTLQLLLLALTYLQLIRIQARPTRRRFVTLAIALGLLCLAYPPAMPLVFVVAAWLFWQSRRQWRDAARAAIPVGICAALIAPATIHNWYTSGGDLFLIQSVTAVNLRQGNQPDSAGGFTPIVNTSKNREGMFEDIARQYTQATGKPARWADIDRYYRDQVIQFWLADPPRTIKLAGIKLYWFLTSRNYGDIYVPRDEMARGLDRWFWLTPLPVAWLMGPAVVGLIFLLRRPVRHLPECAFFFIPLLTVLVFWFNPRYRLPAIPMIVVLAAWMIERSGHWRVHRRAAVLIRVAAAVGIVLGPVNRAAGFDLINPAALSFHLALALREQGQLEAAVEKWREGVSRNPSDTTARTYLGDLLYESGRFDEALVEYERVAAQRPEDAGLMRKLGQLLIARQRFAEADALLSGAVSRQPNDAALVSLLASAKQGEGQLEAALQLYERAVALAPENAVLRCTYGRLLMQLQRWADAQTVFNAVIAMSPNEFDAHYGLGVVLGQLGDFAMARASLARAVELQPRSVDALFAIGAIDLQQGRLPEAAESFRRALAIDPKEARCLAALKHVEELQKPGTRPSP